MWHSTGFASLSMQDIDTVIKGARLFDAPFHEEISCTALRIAAALTQYSDILGVLVTARDATWTFCTFSGTQQVVLLCYIHW